MIPGEEADDFVLLDRHYNRAWKGSTHFYLENISTRKEWTTKYEGMLKCKLVHGETYSIIMPEFVFLNIDQLSWIQPLHFTANFLQKNEQEILCGLFVDISCGQTIAIHFEKSGLIHHYEDGSELYKCSIDGPERLKEYCTGIAKLDDRGLPIIQLFHHTSSESKEKILESNYFIGSKWNIQGNKELDNIEYVYFTCLPRLDCNECLKTIAMSSDGKFHLRRDPTPPVELIPDRIEDKTKQEFLELQIYREDTSNRTHTIDVWIDPEILSPNHLIRHYDGNFQIWYEVISAFIYRVGILPKSIVKLGKLIRKEEVSDMIYSNHAIVGDGWTIKGLTSPFDEENTDHVLKIEKVPSDTNILDFWFDNENSDRYKQI